MLKSLISQDSIIPSRDEVIRAGSVGLALLDELPGIHRDWLPEFLWGAVDRRPLERFSMSGWGRQDPEDSVAYDSAPDVLADAVAAERLAEALHPGATIALSRDASKTWTCILSAGALSRTATAPTPARAILDAAFGPAIEADLAAAREEIAVRAPTLVELPQDGSWPVVRAARLPGGLGIGVFAGGELIRAPRGIEAGESVALVPYGAKVPAHIAESLAMHEDDPELAGAVEGDEAGGFRAARPFLYNEGYDPVEGTCLLPYAEHATGTVFSGFAPGEAIDPDDLATPRACY